MMKGILRKHWRDAITGELIKLPMPRAGVPVRVDAEDGPSFPPLYHSLPLLSPPLPAQPNFQSKYLPYGFPINAGK